jgi:hypothetical protein
MKSALLGLTAAVFVLGLFASPASAATANFQGDCLISHTCDFDAQRPFASPSTCSPASISSYSWSFSDGGTASGVLVTHFFSLSSQYYTATLTITCSNGTTASLTRNISWGVGVGGVIGPAIGYN